MKSNFEALHKKNAKMGQIRKKNMIKILKRSFPNPSESNNSSVKTLLASIVTLSRLDQSIETLPRASQRCARQ